MSYWQTQPMRGAPMQGSEPQHRGNLTPDELAELQRDERAQIDFEDSRDLSNSLYQLRAGNEGGKQWATNYWDIKILIDFAILWQRADPAPSHSIWPVLQNYAIQHVTT